MSVRTTITLDDDLVDRIKRESRSRGASFSNTVNILLRRALPEIVETRKRRTFSIKPSHMGYRPELNYDCVEALIEYGEGEMHR
jgi:hypothetical protein